MSKYFYRIFTIIDLDFGAMQPCSSGLGMTLEASDFRSVRRLVAYSSVQRNVPECSRVSDHVLSYVHVVESAFLPHSFSLHTSLYM